MVHIGHGVGQHHEPHNREPDGWAEARIPSYDVARNDALVFVELLPREARRAVEARQAARAQARRERTPRVRKLITPVRRARTASHEASPSRRSRKACSTSSSSSKDPPPPAPAPSRVEIELALVDLLPRRERVRVLGAMRGWWS